MVFANAKINRCTAQSNIYIYIVRLQLAHLHLISKAGGEATKMRRENKKQEIIVSLTIIIDACLPFLLFL
jgi:hypothetical protein